jgi:hypothetical protein
MAQNQNRKCYYHPTKTPEQPHHKTAEKQQHTAA